MPDRPSILDVYLIVWSVALGVLMAYWQVAEAAQPGTQYANPLVPCAWLATFPAGLAAVAHAAFKNRSST